MICPQCKNEIKLSTAPKLVRKFLFQEFQFTCQFCEAKLAARYSEADVKMRRVVLFYFVLGVATIYVIALGFHSLLVFAFLCFVMTVIFFKWGSKHPQGLFENCTAYLREEK